MTVVKLKAFTLHLMIFAGWLLMSVKVFWLQVHANEKIDEKIESQFATHIQVRARRGDILDSKGRVLATSVMTQSAFIDPKLVNKKDPNLKKLPLILGISSRKWTKILKKDTRFVWLKRKMSSRLFQKISKLNLKGVGFLDEYKRVYPSHESASFLLGKVNIDGKGLSGLELQYDHLLRGDIIKRKALRDGRGHAVLLSNYEIYDDLKGESIKLALDIDSQAYLFDLLKKRVEKVEAKRAWGALMDIETGEIVSNAQVFSEETSASNRNIMASEIHEQGSVMKTFSFFKAMNDLNLKPSSRYDCYPKGFRILNTVIRNSHEEECETETVIKAFSRSLNTVSAQLALELGEDSLIEFYKKMGFNKKTEIDFPGESHPIFHEKLSGSHQLAALSFGHGIALNSMQVLRAYAALFSDQGALLKPSYLRSELQIQKQRAALLSTKQQFLLKNLLSSVVSEEGTAPKAHVSHYLIGGKTGTAQKPDLENGGYSKDVIASFVGVFPLTQPKYVALITVDEPKTMRSGGSISAPVFSDLAEFVLRKNQILPDNIHFEHVEDLKLANKSEIFKETPEYVEGTVPELRGYTLRQALKRANELDLKLNVKGSGRVASIQPSFGTEIPKDRQIVVQLSL